MGDMIQGEAWQPFLRRWSEEWVAAHGRDESVADGWLGRPPASAEHLAAAEARLGRVLPPSFRAFLLATDGWRHAGSAIRRLRGTADLGWVRDLEPSWIINDHPDADLVRRSLQISETDEGVVFLDPEDVDEHGEWAAYTWFLWTGMPAQRYGSFSVMMHELYAGFHALSRPECQTQRDLDEKVERARLASLGGEVDGPLAVLEEAVRFGRLRANFLLFQMRALLRDPDAVEVFDVLLWNRVDAAWVFQDPLFAQEVLPFLYIQHRYTFASLAKRDRQLVAGFHARAKQPLRFGGPDFDAAVHVALAVPDQDEAWALLREAMSLWRPANDDHLGPIGLLADERAARLITPERGREILAVRCS